MNRQLLGLLGLVVLLLIACFVSATATDAEMFFASDARGENPVTKIQEGDQVWIVVHDPDEDIDCDVRDKIWTDVKVMDAKTGAYIVWDSRDAAGTPNQPPHRGHYPGRTAGSLAFDFLEETDRSTGRFTSKRPFQIGTRVGFGNDPTQQTHIAGPYNGGIPGPIVPTDFQWGNYLYADSADPNLFGDNRIWVAPNPGGPPNHAFVDATNIANHFPTGNAYLPGDFASAAPDYILGRFENMDTLMGLYLDPSDGRDVATMMAKIIDTMSSIVWGQEIYKDANGAAEILVEDPDENLNCERVEYVPVFVIVNPGSWNPPQVNSATTFCALKRFGGVMNIAGAPGPEAIVWYNIYNSGIAALALNNRQVVPNGTYYIQYPVLGSGNVSEFDAAGANGVTRVMFYAQETGPDTGVFRLQFNNILRDLGFNSLDVGDVLTAYYVDPNDQDDVSLATSYIESREHISVTSFTDANRSPMEEFWLGRDSVYAQVLDQNANVDACCPEQVVVHICDAHEVDDTEWLILDELSSNTEIFFSNQGLELASVWDALGVGLAGANGGFQLQLDNWALEGFNEDHVYARYNDVVYPPGQLAGLGDLNNATAFPPLINNTRVDNDISFAMFAIADTQVYNGSEVSMAFLDRLGNRVLGYANSDCVFVEVVDEDQDEDQHRRERIDGFWDWDNVNNVGQNIPFGPVATGWLNCGVDQGVQTHPVNALLGHTHILDNAAVGANGANAKLYVLNPRNGRWQVIDLLETGTDTATFRSVTCIPLVDPEICARQLGVLPGDTIIAVYMDPSNHSDIAWISIKVGVGGGGGYDQPSATQFTDEQGISVAQYTEGDAIFVKVTDPSHAGKNSLEGLAIDGEAFALFPFAGGADDEFLTPAISLAELGVCGGATLTATYTDPTDDNDTSTDTIDVVSGDLIVDGPLLKPNPFSAVVAFTFKGQGVPKTFEVTVYDLVGRRMWESGVRTNVAEIPWDGRDQSGRLLANGPYFFVMTLTGADEPIDPMKGKVFIHR